MGAMLPDVMIENVLKRHQLQRAAAGHPTLLVASIVALSAMLSIERGTTRLRQCWKRTPE
jgi:hypothetical protein